MSVADIIVTGSRISRPGIDTPAPVQALDKQLFSDRGYIDAASALNQLSSNVPSLNQSAGAAAESGDGQQFPNLFGLGAERTLTLINGRRVVATRAGLNGSMVDSNIIPIGLLERVEVAQAGAAAVYGSDAISGVVNYVLKQNFQGIELDGQSGISSRGDYPTYSLRGTIGTNFADGRGNIAFNVDWAKTAALQYSDRPFTNISRLEFGANPADNGLSDGVPSIQEILDTRFFVFNANGVVFDIPAPLPMFMTQVGGSSVQFAPNGSLIPFNTGAIVDIPFASGGDGTRVIELSTLRSGVERLTGNVVAHYDLTPDIRASAEFAYARTKSVEVVQGRSQTVLNQGALTGSIVFTRDNAFLSPTVISQLSDASPTFAAGGPLFLSKTFYDDFDLVDDPRQYTTTEVYRGVLGLNGKFDIGNRSFDWSVSGSYGRVEGGTVRQQVVNARYENAIDAVFNGSGAIVCAINADASTSNDDPACAPINPFGRGNVSQAARNYVTQKGGSNFVNEQTDLLATLGGSLVRLPGGDAKFNIAYEHRHERSSFDPLPGNRLGLFGGAPVPALAASGRYSTNELSGELLLPLVGEGFTLPLMQRLDLSGAYRYVDNSIAGKENIWSLGANWAVVDDLSLRISKSRNFRAPTLTQITQPATSNLAAIDVDPCDADNIDGGPNPNIRRASCLALFQANPAYGTGGLGSPAVGASADARLAAFQDPSENFSRALVRTGGNPELRNEISNTLTYGIVLQPRFIPGLTVTADRIEIDLKDGLSAFTTADFAAACYDNSNAPEGVCGAFARSAVGDGVNPAGTIIAGTTTTFNAGLIKFRGEVYNLDYRFSLDSLFGGSGLGKVAISIDATHTSLLKTSVTGATFTRSDDTALQPEWRGNFNVAYSNGPVRLTYQLNYLSSARAAPNATIETTPNPFLKSNMTHDISAQIESSRVTFRVGVSNLTDKAPSYPDPSFGDIIGRYFFAGAKVKF
ncbi:MAG TPA: TonB-dependent receptor [Sphingobium sp.]